MVGGRKVHDISGNVWRHSVSVLTIMEGFKTDPFYNDFTLPTIDGFHNHILGGSWISLGNCSSLNARYGFRSGKTWFPNLILKLNCRDPACSSANAPNTRIHCILGICS